MSMKVITLKDYRAWINSPRLDQYESLPVVYAKDDEGNGFDRVLCEPDLLEDVEISNDNRPNFPKAVCIN